MAQIGNVLGWPLFAMPSTPGPRQVDWTRKNVVGAVTNPYTGKQQTQAWNSNWLEAVVTMPPMSTLTAGVWESFLDEVQGQLAVFYFGDAQRGTPQGTAAGNGTIKGSFQGQYQLTTGGWNANQQQLLLPGDWIQVGWRLYRVTDTASADGAGDAAISIFPQVREVPANGAQIITQNPQGLFRMAQNQLRSSQSYNHTVTMSFSIREAR